MFARNMTAKAFSLGVNLLISFFLTPYIVSRVGSEAYGFVGLANDFVDIARIAAVALNSMALRFIAISLHKGDEKQANRYFSSVMIANFILCLFFLLPLGSIVLFVDKLFSISSGILSDVRLLWMFIFMNFLLSIQGSSLSVALFTKNRIDKESLRSAESVGLRALVLCILYGLFPTRVWYVGLSYCILTIYVVITNIYYTKKYLSSLTVSKKHFDKIAVKELLSAGAWNCLTKVSTILFAGLDLVLVNLFVGRTEMGTVSIAKTLPNTILSVFVILSGVFLPRMTEDYAAKQFEKIAEDSLFSIKFLGACASVPIVMVTVFGDVFYSLWMPTENARLLWMLSSISCILFAVSLSTQNLWNIFTVTNRVRLSACGLFFTALGSVLAVLIGVWVTDSQLVRLLIIPGVSMVYQILMTVFFLPRAAAGCLSLSEKVFYAPMGKVILLDGILVAICFMVKTLVPVDSWKMLILALLFVMILSFAFALFFVFDKKERAMLSGFFKNRNIAP